jgi:hypothetical protein
MRTAQKMLVLMSPRGNSSTAHAQNCRLCPTDLPEWTPADIALAQVLMAENNLTVNEVK